MFGGSCFLLGGHVCCLRVGSRSGVWFAGVLWSLLTPLFLCFDQRMNSRASLMLLWVLWCRVGFGRCFLGTFVRGPYVVLVLSA